MPYMYALYVCIWHFPMNMVVVCICINIVENDASPRGLLYVCMPYMHAVYVCFTCMYMAFFYEYGSCVNMYKYSRK